MRGASSGGLFKGEHVAGYIKASRRTKTLPLPMEVRTHHPAFWHFRTGAGAVEADAIPGGKATRSNARV